MPADDFDRWNASNHRWTGEKADLARRAWLAAEARLLDPRERSLPEVIALEVLKGEHANLGILVDWLMEQGLLDVAIARRFEQLRAQHLATAWRLAAGVAHDFNNLLTVVIGYGQLLIETLRPDDPAHEMAVQITLAGQQGACMTRPVLALGRHIGSPAVESLDLAVVVDDLRRMLQRFLGHDIELNTNLRPGRRINAARTDIERILFMLAVNARDAMPTGGTVTIETRSVCLAADQGNLPADVRPGPYVLLAVRDTGRAIPPEARAKMPGLATVAAIVRNNGGHIEVQSEPAVGSTFRLYLPDVSASA
jgi:signal transduction histidine kinase